MPDLCSGWSIPLNKPVFTMTTVVQKQTSSLHVYKMHLLFLLVMFLTCTTIVTELVHFSGEPLL